MLGAWVVLTDGVPTVSDFMGNRGAGAPICVNFNTSQAYYLAPGDVVTPLAGGAPSHAWTTIYSTGSWPVAQIDVNNLSGYNELLIIGYQITLSVSGVRAVRVSTDNGANFYSTTNDYRALTTAGIGNNEDSIAYHDTANTGSRSLMVHIRNLKGPYKSAKTINSNSEHLFVGSSSDINAIRFYGSGGGNITGGVFVLLGR